MGVLFRASFALSCFALLRHELEPTAYLKASNTGGGDRFGVSVAISGDTLAVGADHEESDATGVNGDQNDNSAEHAGAVYVFIGLPVTQDFTINAGLNDVWFNPASNGTPTYCPQWLVGVHYPVLFP